MSVGAAPATGVAAARLTIPPPPDRMMSPPSALAAEAVTRPSRLITALPIADLLTAATKTELARVSPARSTAIRPSDPAPTSGTRKSTRSKSPPAPGASRIWKVLAEP